MKKRTKIIWAVIAAVIVIWLVASASYVKSITMYPVFCKDWVGAKDWSYTPPAVADFANCHKPQALPREVYTTDMENKRVIESSPDSVTFYELTSCTIVDVQTWKCEGGASMVGARSRNGQKFVAYGLTAVIFVTESQWASINNGAPSPGSSY